MKLQLARRLSVTLTLASALLIPCAPGRAALPLLPEQIAVTCFSGTINYYSSPATATPNLGSNGNVVAIFDTRTSNIGPLIPPITQPPVCWSTLNTPPYGGFHNETGQRWNAANLGEVFGITIDDATPPNIYVTATDCYNIVGALTNLPVGPGGRGGVYKLNGTTGAISSTSLPNDPVAGPGHGNVCYRKAGSGVGYLYVSDLENGMIYRLNASTLATVGSPFDHGVQGRPNESLSPIADNGTPGLTQYGRRIWGVQTFQNRLFYAVWWEDSRNPLAAESNEIWSVDLDGAGNFIPATARRRITIPNFTVNNWSHPIASIDFSPGGNMFLAERYWQYYWPITPTPLFGAHHTRILRYTPSGTNWVTTPSTTHHIGGDPGFYFANNMVGANSAGGVAVNCDESIWATGDMFPGSYSVPPNVINGPGDLGAVYGTMRIPTGGNSLLAGYGYGGFAIDFDGNTNSINKFAVGAVTTMRSCCLPPPTGMVAWWPLDEGNGATTFTDLSGTGNNALVESGGPVGSFGSPILTVGKVAAAKLFVNASTRGRALNAPSLNFGSNSFSADAWFAAGPPALPTTWRPIVDKFNTATSRGYAVGITNDRLAVIVGNGTTYTYVSSSSVGYGPWNFLGVAVDRVANKVYFHVNGTNEPPQTLVPTGNYNSTNHLLIGASYDPNNITEMALDEVELFNRAVTGAEFTALWAADRSGKCKDGQSAPCTNGVVSITCPSNLVIACAPIIYYPPPVVTTTCGTITSVVCTPPSGSSFPLGTNVVTCSATNSSGQSATCSFTIVVQPDTTPPVIDCQCLANQAHEQLQVVACKGVVPDLCLFFSCFSDNCCLKSCTQSPPAGTMVGPGVHPITVTITDCATNTASCVLPFVVTAPSTGCETPCLYCPPPITVIGCPPRMPNFATNMFAGSNCLPAGPLLVMQSIPPGTALPIGPTIVTVQVCDALGSCTNCDVTVNAVSSLAPPVIKCPSNQVIITCSNSAVATYKVTATGQTGPVVCTPPSGTVFPLGTNVVTCSATNACGAIATCSFTIVVKPAPPGWPCGKHVGVGIPFDFVSGATMAILPVDKMKAVGPAICVFPNPIATNSGIKFSPGTAQAITFTTELSFDAPEGASIDLVLPADVGQTNDTPLLSFRRKSGPGGYCVKTAKRYVTDPTALYRSIAVGTNGELFPSFTWTTDDMDTNVLMNIYNQPGVTSVVVTVSIDCRTRETTLDFSHCVWTADLRRKGWDGCIYGNRPPGTHRGRLILTPVTPVVSPPVTELSVLATGLSEFLIDDPSITARGRRWGDGHVTLMKAYDDGEAMRFVAAGEGGGVHVDLGHADSFDVMLAKFGTNLPPGETLLTRTIGPIRGLTNRPPPPFLDALLLQAGSGGVVCSADFTNIDSPTVWVQILNNGAIVAERTGVAATLEQPLFTLPDWPNRLGKLGGATPCRRGKIPAGLITLPGGGPGQPPQVVFGNEFRVLAELPPGAPHPDYYSSFEFIASEGGDWGITNLQRTLTCTSAAFDIFRAGENVNLTWDCDGFLLQGAENAGGPWYDLGVESPALLPLSTPYRFFRLNSR